MFDDSDRERIESIDDRLCLPECDRAIDESNI